MKVVNIRKYLLRVLAILMILVSTTANAWEPDEWRKEDTYRQLAFSGLLAIDWLQTLEISKSCSGEGAYPYRYRESNIFLGECPSRGDVNTYMAVSMLGHAGISYVLPHKWRVAWQYVWIGIEVQATSKNFNAGIRVEF